MQAGRRAALFVLSILAAWSIAYPVSTRAVADGPSPDPHAFLVPAGQLPWKTNQLLDARVESDDRATGDALVIYNTTVFGDPDWAALRRVTGWYENALLWKGRMNPALNILVSEYGSVSDAERAFQFENHSQSYRPARSHPQLGTESVEYGGSVLTSFMGGSVRVEDSIIYTRVQNLEVDVAVFDVHKPQYRWEPQYRRLALALAQREVAIAERLLPPTS
jgi:hypothetical protein